MAIDDPVGIAIRQVEEAINGESYLPNKLVKSGFTAVTAGLLAKRPMIASIISGLFISSAPRFEERILRVAEELDAQQKTDRRQYS